MNPGHAKLLSQRSFQIAVVWEALCVIVGVVVFLRTGKPEYLAVAILAGAAPISAVLIRFIQAQKTAQTGDRQQDIVQ